MTPVKVLMGKHQLRFIHLKDLTTDTTMRSIYLTFVSPFEHSLFAPLTALASGEIRANVVSLSLS
jgi:hypothetical protein